MQSRVFFIQNVKQISDWLIISGSNLDEVMTQTDSRELVKYYVTYTECPKKS